MSLGSKILIFFTRADGYVATRLMCRLICNLPEYNIRIFQSACFLFLIYRYVFRIADPYITCCRIFRCAQQHVHIRQNITLVAYCPDRQNITLVALRQRYAATRPNNSGTYSKKLTDMT